jgi:glycosyltransferase involved in cell wall biosynthesis
MRVSIVTVSLNQVEFLEDTLRSVLAQDGVDLDYVVIDGGSTDGSVDTIRRYEHRLSAWVCEPDRSQVDALNKGLEKTTGEIFGFVNSDDLLLPGALRAVATEFEQDPELRWLCGDTVFFGAGHPTELVEARVPRTMRDALCWNYRAPQPGMFWRRELLDAGFDERWQFCFDHELYLRLLLQGQACRRLPLPVAAYRLHDRSKTVVEQDRFGDEFDRIAEAYEPMVSRATRRRSRAVRHLRRAHRRAEEGKRAGAVGALIVATAAHPRGVLSRPYLGVARTVLARRRTR